MKQKEDNETQKKYSKIRIKRQIDKNGCMKNRNIKYKKYKKVA